MNNHTQMHPSSIHAFSFTSGTVFTSGYLPVPVGQAGVIVHTDSLFFQAGIETIAEATSTCNQPLTPAEMQAWENNFNASPQLQELAVNAILNPALINHEKTIATEFFDILLNFSTDVPTPLPVQLIGYPIEVSPLQILG